MKNYLLGFIILFIALWANAEAKSLKEKRPNVIIILTDDQGYGDLSCHGNPILKTPNLDKLHDESIRFTDFHVAPVCTPTRGQLLTGKDAMHNGAFAWAYSREIIHRDLKTIAEVFKENGYATGHFGKWHLGDNYPYRPIDRGFDESIKLGGASVAQTPDYWDNDNFDDHYEANGTIESYAGYATDIWFKKSIEFAEKAVKKNVPFFIYLPTNVPHEPLIVDKKYSDKYLQAILKYASDNNVELNAESISWFYGMLDNFDENMGKLEDFLIANNLKDNTILIYMTDNGGTAGVPVFNSGMRGHKGTNYEGGHRVPFFISWPKGSMGEPRDINELTEIQDIFPTLVDLCNLKCNVSFDGESLDKLIKGAVATLPNRTLVVQHATAPIPTKYQSTVMKGKWRLVKGKELYNISNDPHQDKNVADENKDLLIELNDYYEKWWNKYYPSVEKLILIPLSKPDGKEVYLSCFDWYEIRGDGNVTVQMSVRKGVSVFGYWNVEVTEEGNYQIRLARWPKESDVAITEGLPEHKTHTVTYPPGIPLPIKYASLKIGDLSARKDVNKEDKAVNFSIYLKKGSYRMEGTFLGDNNDPVCGSYYAYVEKIE